jgi:hypothetical protein
MDSVNPTGPPPTITTGTRTGGAAEDVDERVDHAWLHVDVSHETRRSNGNAKAARHAMG